MSSIYNPKDNINDFVSGNLKDYQLKEIDAHRKAPHSVSPFFRVVVLEVISDPISVTSEEKKIYWAKNLQVSNFSYADVLPRNTIIGRGQGDDNRPMFLFPFFPSHLALPCKAGEVVWAIFQDPIAHGGDDVLPYWMCRITQPHFVDDVNHTHAPRIHETSYAGSTLQDRQKNDGLLNPYHELRNGPVRTYEKNRSTMTNARYIIDPLDTIFEEIVTKSDAGKTTQYESIPRFRKRPGDIAIEGTNNSLIVLGTDRSGQVADYSKDENGRNFLVPNFPKDDLKNEAGSIDIVVGRGQTLETFGTAASTTSIVGSHEETRGEEIKKELNKTKDHLSTREGDVDFKNDRSRVLVSQRTNVDKNFNLKDYNSSFSGKHNISDSTDGDAVVVIKTDKVRIIARSDVQIVVTGNNEGKSQAGQSIKNEKSGPDEWASIVVSSDGSIIFKPSKSGYIKLGSEKADKALLCTDKPAVQADGTVTSPPVVDTMLGFIGTGEAGQGTWAKKILVD
jgi:hypothetical protein